MTYECLGREFFEYSTHKICIRVAQRNGTIKRFSVAYEYLRREFVKYSK